MNTPSRVEERAAWLLQKPSPLPMVGVLFSSLPNLAIGSPTALSASVGWRTQSDETDARTTLRPDVQKLHR
jgi:hypothetical protein